MPKWVTRPDICSLIKDQFPRAARPAYCFADVLIDNNSKDALKLD